MKAFLLSLAGFQGNAPVQLTDAKMDELAHCATEYLENAKNKTTAAQAETLQMFEDQLKQVIPDKYKTYAIDNPDVEKINTNLLNGQATTLSDIYSRAKLFLDSVKEADGKMDHAFMATHSAISGALGVTLTDAFGLVQIIVIVKAIHKKAKEAVLTPQQAKQLVKDYIG